MRPVPQAAAGPPTVLDFGRAPFIVIWEVTQACELACRHCRAEARPWRDAGELTMAEGSAFLDEVRRFGRPLMVLTGGDPALRPDLCDLIRYGTSVGLRMTLTPSGTPRMTRDRIRACAEAGLQRMAVSVDGATPAVHDAFRRVAGSYGWTMDIINGCHAEGVPVQINTTVTKHNLRDLEAIEALMLRLDIVLWSVFFLVPTGRGRREDTLSAREFEIVFHRLYELGQRAPFDIKTTAAPHYRRVVLERDRAAGRATASLKGVPAAAAAGPGTRASAPTGVGGGMIATAAPGAGGGIGRSAQGVNDGKGLVFVSHVGDIFPSGFLPVKAGNVRYHSLVDVYRRSQLFLDLRNPTLLRGKCGRCEYREVCGGSRGRAFAIAGDYLASEPYCVYRPPKR
jgi:radical SAM protein